jgi:hypothetical protein
MQHANANAKNSSRGGRGTGPLAASPRRPRNLARAQARAVGERRGRPNASASRTWPSAPQLRAGGGPSQGPQTRGTGEPRRAPALAPAAGSSSSSSSSSSRDAGRAAYKSSGRKRQGPARYNKQQIDLLVSLSNHRILSDVEVEEGEGEEMIRLPWRGECGRPAPPRGGTQRAARCSENGSAATTTD